MGKIALEEHMLLNREDHIDRWRTMVPMIPEQFQQRLIAQLTDTSRRLEVMDQAGIDLAMLSSGAVVQGSLEPRAALRMARQANDHLAEVVRARPDRFAAFATTPVQHPEEGADELQRAVEQLGLAGTMLFGQTGGRYVDDRSFDPFWERAQDLDVPVYLHAADAAAVPPSQAGRPELRARPGAGRPRRRRTRCGSCSAGSRGCGSSWGTWARRCRSSCGGWISGPARSPITLPR
jgi:2,3-dihydroxybenzoate decarboxylase